MFGSGERSSPDGGGYDNCRKELELHCQLLESENERLFFFFLFCFLFFFLVTVAGLDQQEAK